MMVEQLSGHLLSKDKNIYTILDKYLVEREQFQGNCEIAALMLSRYLPDNSSKIVQDGYHTLVLYNSSVWIDIYTGILLSKDFQFFEKLNNFSKKRFNSFWQSDTYSFLGDNDKFYVFLELKTIAKRKCNLVKI